MRQLIVSLILFWSVSTALAVSPQGGFDTAGKGKLSGQVQLPDKSPLTDGYALFYDKSIGPPPDPYKYWRIPDLIIPMDSEGKFSTELAAGTYFVATAHKKPGTLLGPPSQQEFYYLHTDQNGSPQQLIVTPGAEVSMGIRSASLWDPAKVERSRGITSVSGTVRDLDGKPVAGVLVFASRTDYPVAKPLFVSDRTDVQGRYQLRVNDGGLYFLRVRSVIGGGSPRNGELLNITDEFTPVKIDLQKEEQKKGIDLKVKAFQRSRSSQGAARNTPQATKP